MLPKPIRVVRPQPWAQTFSPPEVGPFAGFEQGVAFKAGWNSALQAVYANSKEEIEELCLRLESAQGSLDSTWHAHGLAQIQIGALERIRADAILALRTIAETPIQQLRSNQMQETLHLFKNIARAGMERSEGKQQEAA